jgi:hypothetical protein
MFESQYVYKYLGAIAVLGFASYYGNQIKQKMSNNDENDELIRKYLLNESPLYGMNRPKLWIHSKYEINARSWKNFQSRNSTDLNQPYLHQTIRTIINCCGNDFNVCLIDDETFSKLIPDWDVNLATLSEPFKSNFREIAMLQLLYIYGGVVLPNSFICMKNVAPLYKDMVSGASTSPFFAEEINHTTVSNAAFVPGMQVMGAQKACPVIKEIIVELQKRNKSNHFSNEAKFTGQTSQLLQTKINGNKATLIDGRLLGIKTAKGKRILLDDLMSEDFLDLDIRAYGVIVPADEVLSRSKYQWLAYLSVNELMKTKMMLTKYLKASIVDNNNEYFFGAKEVKSVTSI